MSSNRESIARTLNGTLNEIISRLSEVKGAQPSVHDTEEQVWEAMLAMGRGLMQLRFEACYEAEVIQDKLEVDGAAYAYQRDSERAYISLFGAVVVKRAYYLNAERGGLFPLDAALSLPERSYSDSVQERLSAMNVWVPQAESLKLWESWLGVKVPKGSLQSSVEEQAVYVADYYQQRAVEPVEAVNSILVVTADGKGIPMTRKDSPPVQARRSKGQKKTAKKEAIVTAVYQVAPYVRDCQALIDALLPDNEDGPPPAEERPVPSAKQTFGTLAGKAAALDTLVAQVAQRDSAAVVHRVALSDGSLALQQQLLAHFPTFSLVLDIIHVLEYLWDAATICCGEISPTRLPWMRQALTWLLTDQLDKLLQFLDAQAADRRPSQQATLAHVSAYLRRNRPFMAYQHYLALGWPIGTGVVEGACRHLVKDRFEQAGMRWSKIGAQALLDLRSVAFNDDWRDFQRFRRRQSHLERYHLPYPVTLPAIVALEAAA